MIFSFVHTVILRSDDLNESDVAKIREIIGAGTIFGLNVFGEWFEPAVLFIMPPGAFITLGFVIALVQKLQHNRATYTQQQALEQKRLEREAGLWKE